MTRNIRKLALVRGGAAEVSARLARQGITLAPATINSALNFARGGKSGQPLRDHTLASALAKDPDIRALGVIVNDILDPPIAADVPIWPGDDPAVLAARQALAATAAAEEAA